MPVYNVENYIERCVRSIFGQTYPDIEYVFVDDCSPDSSIAVVERVVADYPQREKQIKIVKHDCNQGVACSRNTALNNATGDYVMWVDPDDYIDVRFIEKLVEKQQEKNADVVIGGYETLYLSGNIPHPVKKVATPSDYLHLVLQRKVNTALWGKIWRRSIYESNNIRFIPGCNLDEDGHLSARYLYNSNVIDFVDVIGYFYDCSRADNSGNGSFNEKKYQKAWFLYDDLCLFFNEKEKLFLDDLGYWKAKLLAATLINSAKDGKKKDFFYSCREKRLDKKDKAYWRCIGLPRRFAFYIRNYSINRSYYMSMAWVKHFILRQNVTAN